MQNIDFGKIYKNSNLQKPKSSPGVSSKLNIYISIAIIGFTLGAISGIAYEKNISKNNSSRLNELSNVAPGERNHSSFNEENNISEEPYENNPTFAKNEKSEVSENIQNSVIVDNHSDKIEPAQVQNKDKESLENSPVKDAKYIIFAKKYSDKKRAYYDGSQLKKAGYPVFLVKSGDKMKVYIGPIYGKQEAYRYLARIKNIAQYKNAILYKK